MKSGVTSDTPQVALTFDKTRKENKCRSGPIQAWHKSALLVRSMMQARVLRNVEAAKGNSGNND